MRFYNCMKISRHSFRAVSLLLALILLRPSSPPLRLPNAQGKYLFYVGTYTEEGSKSKGIYAFRYDAAHRLKSRRSAWLRKRRIHRGLRCIPTDASSTR